MAIGAFNFYMTAEVTTSNVNNKMIFNTLLTLHASDMYNFNPGMKDIKTGIQDSDNGIFEVNGLGKEFMQYGTYTTFITWEK